MPNVGNSALPPTEGMRDTMSIVLSGELDGTGLTLRERQYAFFIAATADPRHWSLDVTSQR